MAQIGRSHTPEPRSLLMRGVDWLSRREHSRLELQRKLVRTLREGETIEDVEEALNVLESKGYLSNERYAENRVRVRSCRYGNRRLAQELASNGVCREDIELALSQAGSEYERAHHVWQRKFGVSPLDQKEKNRQIRFLASRGFSFDVILKVLSSAGTNVDDDNVY